MFQTMRERVAFEARSAVDDGAGNTQSGPFEVLYECAARIMPKLGGEAVLAGRLSGTQPMLITVRGCTALAAIATEWRCRDLRKGTIYAIKSFNNPDEQGEFIEILGVAGEAS